MSKFKEFLKINEFNGGPVKPTLTAGSNWQFPSSDMMHPAKSFQDMAMKKNLYEKQEFILLQRIQYLVQNIVSEPEQYGISQYNIVGSPQAGGMISGLNKQKMETIGAARNMRFSPVEFKFAQDNGIFIVKGNIVNIDIGKLYQFLEKELSKDAGKDILAKTADDALNGLTKGVITPGNGAMELQRKQYGV